MTTVMQTVKAGSITNRHLIDPRLWRRLTSRIIEEERVDHVYAERIMDQALAFLRLCAVETSGKVYVPSKAVDIGWHTFILHTREYAQFCTEIAGTFIHHVPTDGPANCDDSNAISDTLEAMIANGIVVDEPLWLNAAECGGNKCCSCTA